VVDGVIVEKGADARLVRSAGMRSGDLSYFTNIALCFRVAHNAAPEDVWTIANHMRCSCAMVQGAVAIRPIVAT